MAFILKGIGDAANRVNEITPRFDAMILNYLAQHIPGVCWQFSNRMVASVSGTNVWIFQGLVQAFGYFGISDATVSLQLIRPASGTNFARIFAEINLSSVPNRFRVAMTQQSTNSNIALTQNNLITTPNGIHQIPLYLVQINSAGTITLTDQRPRMERVQNANHALNANDAIRATNLVGNGTIATTTTTTTAARATNSQRIANTAFVHEVVNHAVRFNPTNNALSIWSGRIQLPNGLIIMWREAQSQNETFAWPFPNACIHVGYNGHWGPSTNNAPWASDIAIDRGTVSRTGFRWTRQSGTGRINDRKYIALGW